MEVQEVTMEVQEESLLFCARDGAGPFIIWLKHYY